MIRPGMFVELRGGAQALVDDLEGHEEVLSPFGIHKVGEPQMNGGNWVEIVLDTGRRLGVCSTTRVATPSGFVEARLLVPGERLRSRAVIEETCQHTDGLLYDLPNLRGLPLVVQGQLTLG